MATLLQGRPYIDILSSTVHGTDIYVRIAACSFKIGDFPNIPESYKNFILNESRAYWTAYNFSVLFYMDYIVLFVNNRDYINRDAILPLLLNFIDFIKGKIKLRTNFDCQVHIGVGDIYNDIEDIHLSYNEAVFSNRYKFFNFKESIIFYCDLREQVEYRQQTVNYDIQRLIQAIQVNNHEDIQSEVDYLFIDLEQKGILSIDDIHIELLEIIYSIAYAIKEKNLEIESLDRKIILSEMRSICSYDELKEWFCSRVISISDEVKKKNSQNSTWFVDKAKDYVMRNFEQKITLEDISNYLYLNPAYFSSSFKKITGQNFIDYVNEVKIDMAKQLIISDPGCTMKEVAETVGFENYPYFCKVFKKICNITPLEFKSNIVHITTKQ